MAGPTSTLSYISQAQGYAGGQSATQIAFGGGLNTGIEAAGSGAKSGGIFGMSNAGALTAVGTAFGLAGDIAGIFSKDAQANAANYSAKLQHQQNLQTWKHRNDESLRQIGRAHV